MLLLFIMSDRALTQDTVWHGATPECKRYISLYLYHLQISSSSPRPCISLGYVLYQLVFDFFTDIFQSNKYPS